MKVALLTPTLTKPHPAFVEAIGASVPALDAAGFEHGFSLNVGCPYISYSRAELLRKAMDWGAETVVFLDHDVSWRPEDLVRLIETPDPVVAGTYRYKKDDVQYMGAIETEDDDRPMARADGCIKAHSVPAGFMKMTLAAVDRFMRAYPELVFGTAYKASVDLFNHGVIDGVWYGEDMAFCKRWREKCGDIWLIPDLSISHHQGELAYPGNLHEYLLRQPGGSEYKEAA